MREPDDDQEFRNYMENTVTIGRLALPVAFGKNFTEHAGSMVEGLHDSYTERQNIFSAFARYVEQARSVGIDTRDLRSEMQQIRVGLIEARPNAVFSIDLMREAVSMLDRNNAISEIIERTIQFETRSSTMASKRENDDRIESSLPSSSQSRRPEIRDLGKDRPDPTQRRR